MSLEREREGYVCSYTHHKQLRGQGKYDNKWEYGVWLGIIPASTEVLIGTIEGVLMVRSINRPDRRGVKLGTGIHTCYKRNTVGTHTRDIWHRFNIKSVHVAGEQGTHTATHSNR